LSGRLTPLLALARLLTALARAFLIAILVTLTGGAILIAVLVALPCPILLAVLVALVAGAALFAVLVALPLDLRAVSIMILIALPLSLAGRASVAGLVTLTLPALLARTLTSRLPGAASLA